ncbi:MAG TPA: Rdx family protein [Myxococcaceae bacterium]|nr:Rdx family protein [Myxococcaceae bacterium]
MPRATRAAAALQQELGIVPELSKGPGGTFEVKVDGQVVAARKFWGFPTEEEIVAAVGKAIGRAPSP